MLLNLPTLIGKKSLADRVINFSKDKNLEGKTVSLLGLTFTANTDDTRYSPAINLVEELVKKNVRVHMILMELKNFNIW